MTSKPIRDIVIVGGGTAGWMTAAALAKIMGTERYTITLVESEQIGTVGVGEATIPMLQLYNSVLGLDEDEFVRETNATFKLGIEFVGWQREGEGYFHPFGKHGVDMDGIGFNHYWMRWARSGGKVDYNGFNLETEAARRQLFMRTEADGGRLPSVNYAFQFDAAGFAAFLRRFCERRGVKRVEGKVAQVHQDQDKGHVTSVELEGGRRVPGDLFVDCTGFRGLLIEQTLKAGYDDWSAMLPVNRAVAVPCRSVEPPRPYTRATAREAGWQWRIPLQHRVGNGYVFSDRYTDVETATRTLLDNLDGEPLADPRVLSFTTGVRRKHWVGNVVAIGLSAGFLEPLESTSIHLIQVAISKLMAMFPRGAMPDVMADRFNAEMYAAYDDVKDFLIAHYHVTERDGSEFWRHVRTMDIPDTLAAKIETFRLRGEVMVSQTELFKETSWWAVLAGQGVRPQGYHPVADVISEDELKLRLSRIRAGILDRLNRMPQHADFIARHCAAETRAVA